MSVNKKIIPFSIILLFSVIMYVFDLYNYLNFESFKVYKDYLKQIVEEKFLLSIFIYIFTYISAVVFFIPVATFMTIIGGFLFGQLLGTCIVVVSATIGAGILFYTAKLASSDLLSKKNIKIIEKMKVGFQENTFSYILTLRLIPIFPFFLVNLASAFFQVSFKIFALGTFLGIIPGTFIYISMGVALEKLSKEKELSLNLIFEPKIFLPLLGLGLLAITPVAYKKIIKR